MKCSQCGFENPDGVHFCSQCGNDLTAQPSAPAPVQPAAAPQDMGTTAQIMAQPVGGHHGSERVSGLAWIRIANVFSWILFVFMLLWAAGISFYVYQQLEYETTSQLQIIGTVVTFVVICLSAVVGMAFMQMQIGLCRNMYRTTVNTVKILRKMD